MAEKSYQHRRYIGDKESMSYILFDSSKSFNINKYQDRYFLDALKIDLGWKTAIDLVGSIWDVINDGLLGIVIEKTRTRWGKFRPWIMTYATMGTLMMCLYWSMAAIFNRDPNFINEKSIPKAVFFLLFTLFNDVFATVRDISQDGLLSTISVNPNERVRLLSNAELYSSIWENIPEWLMDIVYTMLLTKYEGADGLTKAQAFRPVFMGAGIPTVLGGGVLAVFLALRARERIAQSTERADYRRGLRMLWRNRPLRMVTFASCFTDFSMASAENNYFADVLQNPLLRTISTIPGAPLSYLSYVWLGKARERFSAKSLWIAGQHARDVVSILLFLVGSVGGAYKKIPIMMVFITLRDLAYKGLLSLYKIMPREVLYDALDDAELQFGYRAEGIVISTKSMISKLVRNSFNASKSLLMKLSGYDLQAGAGNQTDKVNYALFAIGYLMPALLSMIGLIPQLMYDLTGDKRARMHEELREMRRLRQEEYETLEQTQA